MRKSDKLNKNLYDKKALEILNITAGNYTKPKINLSNIRDDLLRTLSNLKGQTVNSIVPRLVHQNQISNPPKPYPDTILDKLNFEPFQIHIQVHQAKTKY